MSKTLTKYSPKSRCNHKTSWSHPCKTFCLKRKKKEREKKEREKKEREKKEEKKGKEEKKEGGEGEGEERRKGGGGGGGIVSILNRERRVECVINDEEQGH